VRDRRTVHGDRSAAGYWMIRVIRRTRPSRGEALPRARQRDHRNPPGAGDGDFARDPQGNGRISGPRHAPQHVRMRTFGRLDRAVLFCISAHAHSQYNSPLRGLWHCRCRRKRRQLLDQRVHIFGFQIAQIERHALSVQSRSPVRARRPAALARRTPARAATAAQPEYRPFGPVASPSRSCPPRRADSAATLGVAGRVPGRASTPREGARTRPR